MMSCRLKPIFDWVNARTPGASLIPLSVTFEQKVMSRVVKSEPRLFSYVVDVLLFVHRRSDARDGH